MRFGAGGLIFVIVGDGMRVFTIFILVDSYLKQKFSVMVGSFLCFSEELV